MTQNSISHLVFETIENASVKCVLRESEAQYH